MVSGNRARREMELIASLVDLQRDVDGKGEILFFVGQDGHLLDIPASGLDVVFPGGRKAAERNVLGSDFMAVVDQVDAVIDGSSRRYDDLRIGRIKHHAGREGIGCGMCPGRGKGSQKNCKEQQIISSHSHIKFG